MSSISSWERQPLASAASSCRPRRLPSTPCRFCAAASSNSATLTGIAIQALRNRRRSAGCRRICRTILPGYVQWNIPLYDDDLLWVVPGSHRRPDNEEQRRQLLLDPRVELPGGVQVDLDAGDAVVYTNLIMHWGSFYSSRLRRTIHLGYRSFGGDIFPYVHQFHYDEELSFTSHLSQEAVSQFRAFYAAISARNEIRSKRSFAPSSFRTPAPLTPDSKSCIQARRDAWFRLCSSAVWST